jgi:hypothetical protein
MRRFAGLCGVLAFVTFNVGWIVGDLVQRPAFSAADDDISYLGALSAKSPWLYNQIAANLSGALIVLLAVVLLAGVGVGTFLDGLFRFRPPIDRRRLHEHVVARACAQDRVSRDSWVDVRRDRRPRAGTPKSSPMAQLVVDVP